MKKYIIFFFICLFTLISCKGETNSITLKSKHINRIKLEEFPQVLSEKSHFNINFELNDENAIKTPIKDYYYYVLKEKKSDIIEAKLYLRNEFMDTNVSLIALQGNKLKELSVSSESDWYKTMEIPLPKGSIIEIDLRIRWDANGSKELILFPILDNFPHQYSGLGASVIRLFVTNSKIDNTHTIDIQKHIEIEGGIRTIPALRWIEQNNESIPLVTEEQRNYATNFYDKLELSPISYTTNADILYLDNKGDVEILDSVSLNQGEQIILNFEESKMKKFISNNGRKKFLLILNNRNEAMYYDYNAVNEGLLPHTRSFQQVIEIYPVQ
ncbi:hypothetical protein [Paenibacillus sp. Leaf72]|uniref:hypothetical protein n=1 Tax=Paenibacillus sp. Leaf72 TaxID=1736234 RepID=UPI0006F97B16|nr:hypothetical protein [Paenibacillus sp. Leaf72]